MANLSMMLQEIMEWKLKIYNVDTKLNEFYYDYFGDGKTDSQL